MKFRHTGNVSVLGNCTLWWTGTEMRCIYTRKKVKSLSRVRLFETPWTAACQAPPSMGFSRQEYWSVLPFPSPGDLPDPGIELGSLTLQADCLPTEPPGKHRYPGLLPKLEKRILDFIHEAHISLQVELGNLINSCQHFSGLFCS